MTNDQAKADLNKQIKNMQLKMLADAKLVTDKKELAVGQACMMIQRSAVKGIQNTPTNPEVSYGKKGHHPSIAGNPFASDTGTAIRSITFNVVNEGTRIIGKVGSTILNPPYPAYLENGTSQMQMQPRPWLLPAVDENRALIKEKFKGILNPKIGINDVTN